MLLTFLSVCSKLFTVCVRRFLKYSSKELKGGIQLKRGKLAMVYSNNITITDHLRHLDMGLVVTKPVFGVSEKARLKPVSSATETS